MSRSYARRLNKAIETRAAQHARAEFERLRLVLHRGIQERARHEAENAVQSAAAAGAELLRAHLALPGAEERRAQCRGLHVVRTRGWRFDFQTGDWRAPSGLPVLPLATAARAEQHRGRGVRP